MYEKREKPCGIIAVAYYVLFWFSMLLGGKLQVLTQSGLFTDVFYSVFLAAAIIFVLRREHSWRSLGFLSRKNAETDLRIAGVIVAIGVCIKFILFRNHYGALTPGHCLTILFQTVYYLFYIAAAEEILFRGFLQNYLFGLGLHTKLTFCLGALFFAAFHLPYQMYNRGSGSLLAYAQQSFPQLVFTFFFHLAMCALAKKRDNIVIPIAIHFAFDSI